MTCPMKISALANPNIGFRSNSDMIDQFLECSKESCAWYCQYPNGKGECAIHSLTSIFKEIRWS